MRRVLYSYVAFFIYITYIFLFVGLPSFLFRDRQNYESYVSYLDNIIYNYQVEGVSLIFNEPIFLLLNFILGRFFLSETVPLIFVFIIVSSFFIFLKKNSSNLIMFILGVLCFLLISYTFHFQFVILRQALATTIVLYSLVYSKSFKTIVFYLILACFIHSSMFVLLFLILLNYVLKNKSNVFRYSIISFFIFIFGFFVLKLAQIVGVRQADYLLDMNYSPGGGAFLLWLLIYLYIIYFIKINNNFLYDYVVIGLILFLTLYFFNPIVGRLMCSFVPAVILLLVSKFNYQNIIILLLLIFVYSYLIYTGVLVENSLLVDGAEFFKNFTQAGFIRWF